MSPKGYVYTAGIVKVFIKQLVSNLLQQHFLTSSTSFPPALANNFAFDEFGMVAMPVLLLTLPFSLRNKISFQKISK